VRTTTARVSSQQEFVLRVTAASCVSHFNPPNLNIQYFDFLFKTKGGGNESMLAVSTRGCGQLHRFARETQVSSSGCPARPTLSRPYSECNVTNRKFGIAASIRQR